MNHKEKDIEYHQIIAEPIELPYGPPDEVNRWNQASVMQHRHYSSAAEEPDEAPIRLDVLLQAIDQGGLRPLHSVRGWELFPHNLPPTEVDRKRIRALHRAHGVNGNIYAAVLTHR